MPADESGSNGLGQTRAERGAWLSAFGLAAVLLFGIGLFAAQAGLGHSVSESKLASTVADGSGDGSSFRMADTLPSPAAPAMDAATLGVLNYIKVHARVHDADILRLYHAEHANPD